jgi:chondroitin 4-sulfotransferase 11
MSVLTYRLRDYHARLHTKFIADFCFVHINKTGGTSIEKALGIPFQHRTAMEIRRLIGPKKWDRRFSFAFVRNPWDKVASHYHFRVKTNQTGLRDKPVPFNEWVMLAYGEQALPYYDQPKMFMPQMDWISDEGGKVIVDFVGRFERLAADFAKICPRLGRQATLPHVKQSKSGDYRRLYNDEAAETVSLCFAKDLAAFEYTFNRVSVTSESDSRDYDPARPLSDLTR